MKGCPLRCKWCHNPEGLSGVPQLMTSPAACTHCGRCRSVCPHPDKCTACGQCVAACHLGLRKIVGTWWESGELAERLLRDRAILEASSGGITFSGGEPMLQWSFLRETVECLQGLHTAIETCGYCDDGAFLDMRAHVNLVMMDIKHTDPAAHAYWTGVDNTPILRHLEMLKEDARPFIIRLPLIPGVNDTHEHIRNVTALLRGAPSLLRVELLPYHKTAGAKYPMTGMTYDVPFDADGDVRIHTRPLEEAGIEYLVL